MRIGYNVQISNPTNPVILEADLMKGAESFRAATAITYSATGYPIFSGAKQDALSTVRSWFNTPGDPRGGPACVDGIYSLVWIPGDPGEINLRGHGSTKVNLLSTGTLSDGRLITTYSIAKGGFYNDGFECQFYASTSGQPIKEAHIYPPGIDPENPPEFHPDALRMLKGAATIRTLQMIDVLDPSPRPWSARSFDTDRSFNGRDGLEGPPGISYESLARLCVATGADLRYCVPWGLAPDDFVKVLEVLISIMPAGLKIGVTDSNETWNFAFPFSANFQAHEDFGHTLINYDGNGTNVGQGNADCATVWRSKQLWDVAIPFFKSIGRENDLVKIMDSFQVTPAITQGRLRLLGPYHCPTPDKISIALYSGLDRTDSPDRAPQADTLGPDVLCECLGISLAKHRSAQSITDHLEQARVWAPDIKLEAYEAQLSTLFYSENVAIACQQGQTLLFDPGYAPLYLEWLTSLDAAGCETVNLYRLGSPFNEQGGGDTFPVFIRSDQLPGLNDGTDPGGYAARLDSMGSPPRPVDMNRVSSVEAYAIQQFLEKTNPVPVLITEKMNAAIDDLRKSIIAENARSIAVAKSMDIQIAILLATPLTEMQAAAVAILKRLVDSENPMSPTVLPVKIAGKHA